VTTAKHESPKSAKSDRDKKRWKPMKVNYIGDAKDVVRTGGGKFSPAPADPGEVFKPPGSKV
jgi:hypothetical protein